jgi:hypothetical protein
MSLSLDDCLVKSVPFVRDSNRAPGKVCNEHWLDEISLFDDPNDTQVDVNEVEKQELLGLDHHKEKLAENVDLNMENEQKMKKT